MVKKVTSVTSHTTSEGERLSYTYSVINEDTAEVSQENIRGSLVLLDVEKNQAALTAVKTLRDFVSTHIDGK